MAETMLVDIYEMKEYLRVDDDDEDGLILEIIRTAEGLVMDVGRLTGAELVEDKKRTRVAVLYAAAYLYEHREEADHHALTLTLRSLLMGSRKEGF